VIAIRHTLLYYTATLLPYYTMKLYCSLLRGRWNLARRKVGHWNANLPNWNIY